jgi:hypothetical protein
MQQSRAFTLDYLEEVRLEGAGINFSPMCKKNCVLPVGVLDTLENNS